MADRNSRPVKRLRRLSTEDEVPQSGTSSSKSRAPTSNHTPSKLREATSSARNSGGRASLRGGETRASRNKKVIIDESSDEEEEDEEDDEDAEGEEDVDMDDDEDDEDAEGEEDEPMDIAPPPSKAASKPLPKPTVRVSAAEQLPSVEAKEIAMGDASDDEELSELDSDEEQELEEEGLGEDDAEGEDDLGEDDAEGEDDDLDSDEDGGSGSGTPDLSKLTRRQRAVFDENMEGGLMALSNEAQKKKHLTAEEHAMRRAEMARRRKNLSEKRNEEEKIDTINRLLKRQAPKRRGKKVEGREEGDSGAENEIEQEPEKAHPVYTHYVQNKDGVSLAVPQEWLDAPLGSIFLNPVKASAPRPFTGRMVEEVS